MTMMWWAPVPVSLAHDPRVLCLDASAQVLLVHLYLGANGADFVQMPAPQEGEPREALWPRAWGEAAAADLAELVRVGVVEVEPDGLFLTIQTPPFPVDEEVVRSAPRGSWVYAIGPVNGDAVKIGYSTNPWDRLQTIQTSHPETLSVFALMPGGAVEEQAMHRQFAAHRLRSGGEWFALAPAVIRWCKQWGRR